MSSVRRRIAPGGWTHNGGRRLRQSVGGIGRLAAIAVLASLWLACAGPPIADSYDLETVPHPDISAIEEPARRQLEAQREALAGELASATEARPLSDAFGAMGELYQTYALVEPALACYRNAITLDGESFIWPYYLGVALQGQGAYDEAADAFEQAVAKRPDDVAARQRLAQTQHALGQTEAARRLWEGLTEEPEAAAAAHHGLGLIAVEEADWPVAIEQLEAALRLAPEANGVHHALASAYRQSGDDTRAATHQAAAGAVEISVPDRLMARLDDLAVSSGAYLRRGNRALTGGDLDTATAAFRKAIESNPELVDAHRNLALAHVQNKHYDAALEVLREAVERHPNDLWLRFDLGTTYLAKGLNEQAIEAFEKSVEIDPEFSQGHFNLANALIAQQQWDAARGHLERVLAKDPEDGRAKYLLAMASHHTGDSSGAIRQLRELLATDPDDVVARRGLAQIFTETKRDGQARRVYADGIARDTLAVEDRLQLSFQLAELDWRNRRRNQAIQVWRQAVQLDPESSEARTALGNGLQLLNRWPEARQHFAKAVELDPLNAKAWRAETNLWILDKEFEKARRRLDLALESLPDDAPLLHTAARLMATCELASVRDGERALEMARRAYNLENSLDHAETIGMALAEVGEFEKAIQWQRRLLAQVSGGGDQRLLRRIATNLKLYENRRPIRTG